MNKAMNSARNLLDALMEGGIAYTLVIEGTDSLLIKELCSPDYQGDIRIRFDFSENREIEITIYNGSEVIGTYIANDIGTCMALLGEFISIVK